VSNLIDGSSKTQKKPELETSPNAQKVTAANWHTVLGVAEDASREQINEAYRRMISQYHPDKVAQMGEEIRAVANAKSREINAAYEIGKQR